MVSLIIEDDFAAAEGYDHGIIPGAVAREHWTIRPDDPLSAAGGAHWTVTPTRRDMALQTEAICAMLSDACSFHLLARLEADAGEALVREPENNWVVLASISAISCWATAATCCAAVRAR